jgi:hypothetical protein
VKSVDPLKPLWREDAEGGLVDPEAHAGELLAGQRWRRLADWFGAKLDLWTVRFERLGKWLKAIATVLGSAAAIVALIRALRTRNVAPAELPKGGGASTFVDRVDKPAPPKP